jgi:hypothetical protein
MKAYLPSLQLDPGGQRVRSICAQGAPTRTIDTQSYLGALEQLAESERSFQEYI